jgi:hypothetical protein
LREEQQTVMHNELANMPLLQPYCSEQMASVKSCMLVQVPDASDVRYEPQKQALPHTAHTTALEGTRQPIDVSIHVANVPADVETVNRDSGKLTRQQDRVSTATSSQQDGRQFVASGRKICLPTESPHESSPKPSSESRADDICPVVQTDIIFSRLIVVKDKMDQFPWIQTQGSLPNFKRFRKGRAESGNTYSSLVPFAKEPYREADFGREVEEFMREERKRKDAENLADDLFNAERVTSKLSSTELKRPSSLIIIMMRLLSRFRKMFCKCIQDNLLVHLLFRVSSNLLLI